MTSAIALVLDQEFGLRLLGLARSMPVWIVSSQANDSAVAHARALLGETADITTISGMVHEPPERTFLRALYAIDEHHGPASSCEPLDEVRVFGASPDFATRDMMNELGFVSLSRRGQEFSIRKRAQELLNK